MKKYISLLLAIIISFLFVGCTDNTNKPVIQNSVSDENEQNINSGVEKTTELTTYSDNTELIDVIGMTKDTAITALENRKLKVKIVEEYNDSIEENFVIDQIPKPENGIDVKAGDEIKLTVSLGKNKDKFYLKQMLYSDEKTDTKKNSFSVYDGEDYNDEKCINALKFSFTHDNDNYSEEAQKDNYKTYSISYDLDGKYKQFIMGLTHDWIYDEIKVEILGDDKLLFSQGITDKSAIFDVNIDVSKIKIFTIKISGFIYGYTDASASNIIFNNAYFT